MSKHSPKTIFLLALDEEDPIARQEILEEACGANLELRAEVEQLLAAAAEPENMLDRPVDLPGRNPGSDSAGGTDGPLETLSTSGHIGMTIGPYRLMEQIGEGGFGLVFVAQQDRPVQRKVALKILKPGTSSKEVLARFDAERQAVALMEHPNIAKVFDAGVTGDGRPFFVMELVRGVPISEFCDNHRLSLTARLRLFQDVCAAVHHAHQKGVIHRDLKPSNVMVTLHDDRAVVKVIDFGVAKALGQNLTDHTIYTRFFAMIGTPLYMSPEQAQMSGLDVDTRSDIYSLGVLLYELLTGTTPLDRSRLDSVGYDELRRIIREEEPPRPSRRVTTLGNQLTTVSQSRQTQPSRMETTLRGDLDWIVMKALEKDRVRRYDSAAAMSADIRRFLNNEPIEARPPSRRYRLAKFARRNQVPIVTGTLVALALVVGTAASLYQASVAIAERDRKDVALKSATRAEIEAIRARLEVEQFTERLKTANSLLGAARVHEDSDRFAEAAAAHDQAIALVPSYYLVWVERGRMYAKLNLWEEAASDFAAALDLDAPLDTDQWQGVTALFALTDRPTDYRRLRQLLFQPLVVAEQEQSEQTSSSIANRTNLISLNTIRSALPLPSLKAEATALAERADQLVGIGPSRPRFDGEPPSPEFRGLGGGRPSGRGAEREGGRGPGNRPDGRRGEGPRGFRPGGGPGPGEPASGISGSGGPGLGGPGSGGRRPGEPGPRGIGQRLPWGVQHYVAGWAHLRAGQLTSALEHLQSAQEDRGWPHVDMVHFLLAIVHANAQRSEEAASEFALGEAALLRWIEQLQAENISDGPWFDFAEAALLHREAARLVQGAPSRVDAKINAYQQQARDLLLDGQ